MPSDGKEETSTSLQQKSIRQIPPTHSSPAAKQKHVRTGEVCQVCCELEFKLPSNSEVLESSIWVQLIADSVEVIAKSPSCLTLKSESQPFRIFSKITEEKWTLPDSDFFLLLQQFCYDGTNIFLQVPVSIHKGTWQTADFTDSWNKWVEFSPHCHTWMCSELGCVQNNSSRSSSLELCCCVFCDLRLIDCKGHLTQWSDSWIVQKSSIFPLFFFSGYFLFPKALVSQKTFKQKTPGCSNEHACCY